MATRSEQSQQMPRWSRVLTERQWRFISVRGGRGSGKTVNFARAILLRAVQGPLRVLCTREVQDSIKESVYASLVSEMKKMGLESYFKVLSDEIRPLTGGTIIFRGLSDMTADNVKSLADIDIAWVEEAQTITENSFRKLTPSIRAKGSQVWLSWNPELESDFIYQKVVVEGLPNCASLFVNFDQNPWFPDELRLEEQDMAGKDPDMHRHVWLGMPLPAVEGAIYFREISKMESEGRILNITINDELNTYIVMDLGFNDHTSCGVVQQVAGEFRIVDFIENRQRALSWFSEQFIDRGYEGAILVMPHDSEHETLAADGISMKAKMEALGWEVEVAENMSVEQGIRLVRDMLPKTFIDKTRCGPRVYEDGTKSAGLIEHMKRYRRTKAGHPMHDEHSHSNDMVRYVAVHAPRMHNNRSQWGGDLEFKQLVTV
ncbi:PBSX family phage terminase large subunit [Paraburkholderia tropica]|uniref:PBSX family phage terminase large subunit n=1 Tax=Paraburkholderia tropica TaxID=92647 RepID=UPI003D26752C